MEDSIKIKKSTLITLICVVLILGFVGFAFKNFISDDDSLTGNPVKGGDVGSNKIIKDGDVQIVNLGVANYNYDPSTINVEAGKKVRIIGNMEQLQGCLRAFTIPSFGITKIFNYGDNILEFIPTKKGTYGFSCSMGMGFGKLIVD